MVERSTAQDQVAATHLSCLQCKEWWGQLGVRTLGARLTGWAR